MIRTKEAYVSFETAKLLKEKGFDENTLMVYMSYGDLCKCNRYDSIRNSNYNDITKNYFECTAPTHQMAMKWLREVHNIDICVFPYQADYISYSYKVKIYKNKEIYLTITDSKTYEYAVEAALKYCLENLI